MSIIIFLRITIVFGIFAYILWCQLFRKIYVARLYRKGSNSLIVDGDLTSIALQEQLKSKFTYPDLQSMHFDEQNNLVITTKKGLYTIIIDNGLLRVQSEEAFSEGKTTYRQEEAICIKNYIQQALDQQAIINPYNGYKKMKNGKLRRTLFGLAVSGFLIGFVAISGSEELGPAFCSNNISKSYMNEYSTEITIGEAFDKFFTNSKWKSYEIGAQKMVDFQGDCTVDNENVTVLISFEVYSTKFSLKSVKINGEETDFLLTNSLLEKVFETSVSETPEQTSSCGQSTGSSEQIRNEENLNEKTDFTDYSTSDTNSSLGDSDTSEPLVEIDPDSIKTDLRCEFLYGSWSDVLFTQKIIIDEDYFDGYPYRVVDITMPDADTVGVYIDVAYYEGSEYTGYYIKYLGYCIELYSYNPYAGTYSYIDKYFI